MSDSQVSLPDLAGIGLPQHSGSSLDLDAGDTVPSNTPSESFVDNMPIQTEPEIKKEIFAFPSRNLDGTSVTIDLTEDSDFDDLTLPATFDLTEDSDVDDPDCSTPSKIRDHKPIEKVLSTAPKKKTKSMRKDASINSENFGHIEFPERSDEEEFVFPAFSEIADRKAIKEEPLTPPKKKMKSSHASAWVDIQNGVEGADYIVSTELSDEDDLESPILSEDCDRRALMEELPIASKKISTSLPEEYPTDIEDNLFIDDTSNPEATDSGDEVSDFEYGPPKQDSKKRKQRAPIARTARDYHERINATLSSTQRRGNHWKKQRLDKIEKAMKNHITSKKHRKTPRAQAKDFNAAQFFDDLLGNGDPVSEDDLDDGLQLSANTRDGVWQNLLAKYPHTRTKEIKSENNKLVREATSLGYVRVKRLKSGWLLQGMKSVLRNHQLTCVAWMVKRECAKEEPYGGIVADVMGLGKTVQCLGLIVANPQKSKFPNTKATLWIVPASLKSQTWFELNKHTPELGDTSMIYESKRMDNSLSKLTKCDVVITTYGELIKSLPQPDPDTVKSWKKKNQDVEKMTLRWTKDNMEGAGLLHGVTWYRIIIDECHHIKNPETRLFRAALFLVGECRWLLSGTPVMNCYEEFHPMLRFLQEPLTQDLSLQQFQRQYCDISDIGSSRALDVVLTGIIMRRTLRAKILGFPIIKLKPTHREIHRVKRCLPERLLYRIVKEKFQELLSRRFENDDERKPLSTLLAQLTRLRQLIANPDLVARQIMIVLGSEGMKVFLKQLKNTKFAMKAEPQYRILTARLERWIVAKKVDAYKTTTAEDICAVCQQPDEHLMILKKCGCMLCGGCIGNNHEFNIDVQDNGDERGQCPSCRKSYNVVSDFKEHLPSLVTTNDKTKSKAHKEIRKGKDARGFRPTLSPEQKWPLEWLRDYDADNHEEVLPTAKLRGTVLQILAWLKEAQSDKIVVFTQFRFFAILVGIVLELKKVKFIYYTGDMPSSDRSDAVQQMEKEPSIQVMIAGLKCGGTGLNFQFANRGIITDIWWNTCIDEQALGRFQRLGQTKSVYFVRIVVTKTIDSKLIKLQDKKKKAIANVIQDHDLDEAELANVLGYFDGESDEKPDTSDDEDDDEYGDDGF